MKKHLLKALIAPVFFYILYVNLKAFVFNYEARQSYLNKKINKSNKELEDLKTALSTLKKDKKLKLYQELNKNLSELKKYDEVQKDEKRKEINIYQLFQEYQLSLYSEKLVKNKSLNKDLKKLTQFTLSGDYHKLIKMLRACAGSQFIPVNFSLKAEENASTKYTISIWKQE
ncbi:hypothetical protein PQO03_03940 [Lentisphaera profundi]|uniref:Uncharacterized protein n=1 Tax=Lentisphaera profundi TaxID=1658616 RepID=A0ABY7VW41_9BACT|nr:hypothetical protein [Lentisphaera profundi]WDE97107.1 hypothetical protein PQO03_03940 [Lentisphaera profundi]